MKLSKVVLRGLVHNPGAEAHSFEHMVDSFTSQQYELSLVDNVVNVTHVKSNQSIIVPVSEVRYAIAESKVAAVLDGRSMVAKRAAK